MLVLQQSPQETEQDFIERGKREAHEHQGTRVRLEYAHPHAAERQDLADGICPVPAPRKWYTVDEAHEWALIEDQWREDTGLSYSNWTQKSHYALTDAGHDALTKLEQN